MSVRLGTTSPSRRPSYTPARGKDPTQRLVEKGRHPDGTLFLNESVCMECLSTVAVIQANYIPCSASRRRRKPFAIGTAASSSSSSWPS